MKTVFTSLLLVVSFNSFSQSSAKFYFDEAMHPVSKKKAVIYGTGKMDSGFYQLTCYYLKRKNPLACIAHFTDSTQTIHEGWFQYYFENGLTGTKGNYHHGKKEGLWIDYDEKGAIRDSVEYHEGMALMRTGFYDLPVNHQKLITVDVKPKKALKKPVTLAEIKTDDLLKNMLLVRQGRLSVTALTKEEFDHILMLSQNH